MSGESDVSTWLQENLSAVLSFPVPQDLIEYIMTIENERDIDDYLRTLLDFTNPTHVQFCANYKVIRHFKDSKIPNQFETNGTRGKKEKSKNQAKEMAHQMEQMSLNDKKPQTSEEGKKKKKDKYVNLYSPEGAGRDVVMLKGRHHCDCQAYKHRLLNNCLSCGRIVCAQEGSGPCLFCGSLVCSKEEQEFLNAKNAQSQKLYNNLMEVGRPKGWEEALAHRDRLLEFDRTTQRRTRVIDDEGEYFSVGSVWLSPTERSKLDKKEEAERERKHASRLKSKFTLDFAGRQVVPDDEFVAEEQEEEWANAAAESTSVVHPDVTLEWQPEYVPSGERSSAGKTQSSWIQSSSGIGTSRVQDRELLEMTDPGACLSLHQPWASLLVHGIMRHEGRTWYSAHRGRLWIAAASKEPVESEIKEIEDLFRSFRKGEDVTFPKHYPTSCLLGCVTVADVLPQEEYRSRYERRESESAFVFICEDARALSLKFPVTGKHKIYKLDNQTHAAAQKALWRMVREQAN